MLTAILASALTMSAHTAQNPDPEAILASLPAASVDALAVCEIDADALGELLNLSQQDFDQNFDGGGWRPYGREGCFRAAGLLIETWRDHSPNVESDGLKILNWHAGQMYANAGDNTSAIALFIAAKDNDGEAWDLYADATIAFLARDRVAAEAARTRLLDFAPDEAEQAARQRFLDENPNVRMPDGFVTEPPNLAVVDRLLDCWDGSYTGAYGGNCDAGDAPEPVDVTMIPRGCAFVTERIRTFQNGATEGAITRVSGQWLASPGDRDMLVSFLNQDGRESGPGAPFGMAYSEDFAAAIEALDDADIDQLFANMTTPGQVDDDASCVGVMWADNAPFTTDLAAAIAEAETQAVSPGEDAPTALETLSLSRPTFFDDGGRVIFVEQYSLTPITLSRPPSALIGMTVYKRKNSRWQREAGIVLGRSG